MTRQKNVVVIGSGAGGLTAAAYCAKMGAKVTVLEQAAHTGGHLNSFRRKGYCFEPGVHVIGDFQPGLWTYEVFAGLGLDPHSMFCELDPDGFERFRFPDFEIRAACGLDRLQDTLLTLFPDEKKGIFTYIKSARQLQMMLQSAHEFFAGRPKASQWPALLAGLPGLIQSSRVTYASFLDRLFSDPKIKVVLAANSGNYRLPPSRVSVMYGIGAWLHLSQGGFFPRGGGAMMKKALEDVITANGGSLHTNKDVTKILLKGTQAVAVQTADGQEIHADAIVSSIEPKHTFGKLIGVENLPKRLAKKIAKLRPSRSVSCLFLGMRRDLREHGLGNFNVRSFPASDPDVFDRAYMPSVPLQDQILFISTGSLKDDSGTMVPDAGCSTLEMVVDADWADWEKWDNTPSHKRGAEYKELKQKSFEEALAEVKKRLPGAIGDVEVQEFGTPVTRSHYTRAVCGGIFGPELSIDQMGPHRFWPKTPFKNLFIAGSGVIAGGIGPCMVSGEAAARLAMGRFGKK